MDTKAATARIREDWEQEARDNREMEIQIERQLKKWKLGFLFGGLALVAVCAAVVPKMAPVTEISTPTVCPKPCLFTAIIARMEPMCEGTIAAHPEAIPQVTDSFASSMSMSISRSIANYADTCKTCRAVIRSATK